MNTKLFIISILLLAASQSSFAYSSLRFLVNGELGAITASRVAKANPGIVGLPTKGTYWENVITGTGAYEKTTGLLSNRINHHATSYSGSLNLKHNNKNSWIEAMFETGILEFAVDYIVGNDSTLRFDPDGITIKKPKPSNNGNPASQLDSNDLGIDPQCYVSIALCPQNTNPPGATIAGVKVFRSQSCPPSFYCAKYPLAPANIQTLDVVVWRPSKMQDSDCRVAFGYSTCFFDRAFEGGEYYLTFPDFTTFTHALHRQLFPGTGAYPIQQSRAPVTQNVRIDKAADETLFFLDGVAETAGIRQTIRVPRNGNIWYNPGVGKNRKHPDWDTALESGDLDDVEIPKDKRAQFYDKLFREIAEEEGYADPVEFPPPITRNPPYDLSDPVTPSEIDDVKEKSKYYNPPKVQDFGWLSPGTRDDNRVPLSPFGPANGSRELQTDQSLNPWIVGGAYSDSGDPYTPLGLQPPPSTATTPNTPNNPNPPDQEVAPEVPLPSFDAPTMNDILDPIKNMLSPFIDYQAPAFAGTCPQPSFSFYETSFSFSIHCDFIESNRAMIAGFMSVAWTIVGLLIVLRA